MKKKTHIVSKMDGYITYPIPGDFLASVGGAERESKTGVAYSTWHSESRGGGRPAESPKWDR